MRPMRSRLRPFATPLTTGSLVPPTAASAWSLVSTDCDTPPYLATDLQASGGSAVADGYLVEGSTDGGATWQSLGSTTAAVFLATDQCANASELFRVTPYNAAGYGAASAASAAVTVGPQSAAGWYKVAFNDPAATSEPITVGLTAFTNVSGTFTLNNGGWIQADSMADAALKALSGSVTSYDNDYGVTNTFVFGQTGAFRFNPDLQIDGQDVGPAIVAEDEFNEAGHGDQNYTDVYVPVSVTLSTLQVDALTDATAYAAPAGSTFVGFFQGSNRDSSPSDYLATVQWEGHTPVSGTITPCSAGSFAVTVPGTLSTSELAHLTLTVSRADSSMIETSTVGGDWHAALSPYKTVDVTSTSTSTSRPVSLVSVVLTGAPTPRWPPRRAAPLGSAPTRRYSQRTALCRNHSRSLGSVQRRGNTRFRTRWMRVRPILRLRTQRSRLAVAGAVYYYHCSVPLSSLADLYPSADQNLLDGSVVYFRVRSSVKHQYSRWACAPQAYYTWGFGGTAPAEGTMMAKLLGYEFNMQVHSFTWADKQSYDGSLATTEDGVVTRLKIELAAARYPVVLFGESMGGARAIDLSWYLNVNGRPQVGYLGVVDPVAPWSGFENDSHVQLINDQYNGFAPRVNDPFPDGHYRTTGQPEPKSAFTLPTTVDLADNWWRDYDTEWDTAVQNPIYGNPPPKFDAADGATWTPDGFKPGFPTGTWSGGTAQQLNHQDTSPVGHNTYHVAFDRDVVQINADMNAIKSRTQFLSVNANGVFNLASGGSWPWVA